MRIDRFLTLRLLDPFRRPEPPSESARLPVLMYHSISETDEAGLSPYHRVCTSPGRFAAQMGWLAEMGWRGVGLSEGLELLAERKSGDARAAAITFDDGFADFLTAAFPVLRRHGFSATMYLPTAFISLPRQSFKSRDSLTWDEIRNLRQAGIEFGSHTVSHPVLYDLTWKEIEREVAVSKAKIEQELAGEIRGFAYPYAFPQADRIFTQSLMELLRERGYRHCSTTIVGRVQPGDNPLSIKRLPVNQCDDRPLFTAKLNGSYDWLAGPQSWFKAARRRLRPGSRRAPDLVS